MKIICIGRNYADHITELGNERPETPVIFMKPDTAILRNNDAFYYPDFSKDIHYECELLIRINKEGKSVEPRFAHKYYDQIGLGIDFTARDLQAKAKGISIEQMRGWLGAFGFQGNDEIAKKVKVLSGGERARLAMLRILTTTVNLCFLDEPTNHLDLEGVFWLESFFQQSNITMIFIAHQRTLLEIRASRIVEFCSA